jgi:excisionase family DNA binding protein
MDNQQESNPMAGYLTVKELAEAAGVNPSRIRQLIAEGKITAQKVGNINFIKADEARRWLEGRAKK